MREDAKKKLEELGFEIELVHGGQATVDGESEEGLLLRIAKGTEYHVKSDDVTLVIVHLDNGTVDFVQNICLADLEGLKQFNEVAELCFKLLDCERDEIFDRD
ncbi:hypothetical protein [Ligilactobacillus equi]|uniref:Uncharacterized protein n=1 Tax=Ligilactobacillus equi DSM 15833 = JCM 10991 TaxID=1423740 RepID=A0A0R1TH67_9LACO|nr:hypothetical protein [Ligilactobacillus equi]KRL80655.1 hypothetical protein FC36_GL002111 [Ligilactobacillus equi DSM 15833 = JCM 10991]